MNYPIKTLSQIRPVLLGFRKAAGMTQKDVAEKLDITQQSYAQLEANPAAASMERLYKVLRILDVELVLTAAPALASASPATLEVRDASAAEDW